MTASEMERTLFYLRKKSFIYSLQSEPASEITGFLLGPMLLGVECGIALRYFIPMKYKKKVEQEDPGCSRCIAH